MTATMLEQLRMLRDWAPLVGFGRRYMAASNQHDRNIVISDALEWVASRTASTLDDRMVKPLVAVLKTPEGEALVRELVLIVESLPKEPAA